MQPSIAHACSHMVCFVALVDRRYRLRQKRGLDFALQTSHQRPLLRRMLLHRENHAASASIFCASNSRRGKRPVCPAHYQFTRGQVNGPYLGGLPFMLGAAKLQGEPISPSEHLQHFAAAAKSRERTRPRPDIHSRMLLHQIRHSALCSALLENGWRKP